MVPGVTGVTGVAPGVVPVHAGDVGVVVYGVVGVVYGVVGVGVVGVGLVYGVFGDLGVGVGDDGEEDPEPETVTSSFMPPAQWPVMLQMK
jgi:hypothetical protein